MSEVRLIDANALIKGMCSGCIGLMEDGECRFGMKCEAKHFCSLGERAANER